MGNWALHVILLVIMFSGGDFLFAENIFSDSHWISVEKKMISLISDYALRKTLHVVL